MDSLPVHPDVCTFFLRGVVALAVFGATLSGADGHTPPVAATVPILAQAELAPKARQRFSFSARPPSPGAMAVLALKARMATAKVAGYTAALKVTLNGTVLDGRRLLNKPPEVQGRDGRTYRQAAADRFMTYYAPDFTSADASGYGSPGVKSGEFELRVTDLLREGENELMIENACAPSVTARLVLADGELRWGAPPPPPKPRAGPPTGPLPVRVPVRNPRTAYRVTERPDAELSIEVAGERFSVVSRFSTPAGKWERGSNACFEHTRRIEARAEAIVVYDTFRNLGSENLPLMQRHEATAAVPLQKIWLAGHSPAGLVGTASAPENPTVLGATTRASLGLLPLNDEFQVHVATTAAEGRLGLADNQFVLRPGRTYTAEWAIVPGAGTDYFDFVNATRRLLEANFLLPHCFAFLRGGPATEKWSDAEFAAFIRRKSASLVCNSIMSPSYQGHYAHGVAFQRVNHDTFRRHVDRVHRLVPEAKTCVYFHCFINAEEEAAARFPADRVLRADGSHANYGQPFYSLFFPTTENAYGRAVRRNVELILDDIKADGVYWDELEYSAYAYHYGEPWDGCSADIDPQTLRLRRLKSSVTLLTQPWRLALAREILARGPLIGNGQPHTRSMARLKFPRFCETGSRSNCTKAQLHSPIALGDHLTEQNEEDAYRNMVAALDYGCLSHWYGDLNVIPTRETLAKYMYPVTPLELHEGYLIGEERIVTNRSGLFGWGDTSSHEVHVFDEAGCEMPDFRAPQVVREGAHLTELRLAEGWSAAIVRRASARD